MKLEWKLEKKSRTMTCSQKGLWRNKICFYSRCKSDSKLTSASSRRSSWRQQTTKEGCEILKKIGALWTLWLDPLSCVRVLGAAVLSNEIMTLMCSLTLSRLLWMMARTALQKMLLCLILTRTSGCNTWSIILMKWMIWIGQSTSFKL